MLMDTGPAQFEKLAANAFKRAEIEELCAIIAKVAFRTVAGLHPICTREGAGGSVKYHQMVADEIIRVAIKARMRGASQTLAQLAMENLIAQTLTFDEIFYGLCQSNAEKTGSGKRVRAVMDENRLRWHVGSVKRRTLLTCFRNVI